jgi:transcriptional regulator with XRE-family HTH domain
MSKKHTAEKVINQVGKRIYFMRKSKGLSREAFSKVMQEKTGHTISVYNLGMIERGITNTTIQSLYLISQVLDVDVKILFD